MRIVYEFRSAALHMYILTHRWHPWIALVYLHVTMVCLHVALVYQHMALMRWNIVSAHASEHRNIGMFAYSCVGVSMSRHFRASAYTCVGLSVHRHIHALCTDKWAHSSHQSEPFRWAPSKCCRLLASAYLCVCDNMHWRIRALAYLCVSVKMRIRASAWARSSRPSKPFHWAPCKWI